MQLSTMNQEAIIECNQEHFTDEQVNLIGLVARKNINLISLLYTCLKGGKKHLKYLAQYKNYKMH